MNVRLEAFRTQRGATLLVALVMLIVMTLLGLASIRGTSMQERMGANLYDRSLAFQAAESALREAEGTIGIATVVTNSNGLYCMAGKQAPLCLEATPAPVAEEGSEPVVATYTERWNDTTTQWTQASTWFALVDESVQSKLGDTPPEYIIEYMGDFEDGTGCGKSGDTSCKGPRYRITARSAPADGRPNVVLQTTYRP